MKEREGGCTISYITKCICCSISKRESERGKQAISDEREREGGESRQTARGRERQRQRDREIERERESERKRDKDQIHSYKHKRHNSIILIQEGERGECTMPMHSSVHGS